MGASAGGQVDGEKAAKVVASLGYAKRQVGRLLQHGARRTVVMENIFVAMELLLELCEQPATPAFVKQGGLPLLAKVAGATGTATQQPNPAWQAPRPGLEEQVANEGKEQDVSEGEDKGGEGLPAAHVSPNVYEAEAANTAVGCSSFFFFGFACCCCWRGIGEGRCCRSLPRRSFAFVCGAEASREGLAAQRGSRL